MSRAFILVCALFLCAFTDAPTSTIAVSSPPPIDVTELAKQGGPWTFLGFVLWSYRRDFFKRERAERERADRAFEALNTAAKNNIRMTAAINRLARAMEARGLRVPPEPAAEALDDV